MKKTDTKTIQEHEYIEKKIGNNIELNRANSMRQKTIDQDINLNKKNEGPIRRPASSKPDAKYKTPILINKKENVSISKPSLIPSKILNQPTSIRRAETPSNYINNQLNDNKYNMRISPSSSNIRNNNSNINNGHIKQEINRGIIKK